MAGGLALTFGLCLATAGQFLAGAMPAAFGEALRVDGLSALVLVLCGFVGLLSGVYGIGYLRRNDARGLVTPRMRREFYGLIPAYVFAMLLVVGVEQPRHPVDRRRADDAGVGVPRDVPRPRHVARGGVEVPDAGQPRPRLRAARDRAAVRLRPGTARARAWPALHWTRFMAGRAAAASVHAAARRRVRADRLRHEGRAGADAHVEARCLSRSAVAGGAC